MKPALLALILTSVALAGCTGGDEDPIQIEAPDDPVTGAYTFRSGVTADSYKWNLGDGMTVLEGKEVTHTYGFTDGTLTVRLTATTGDEDKVYQEQIVLGTGQNADPTPALEVSTEWATVGQEVTFSAASTDDPDGDPIYVSWVCFRKGDLSTGDGHGHAHGGDGGGGVPFGQTGGLKGTIATDELPAATRTESDFCAAFEADFAFGTDTTVAGAFTQSGVYQINALIKDPKSPATSVTFTLFVSDSKPPATVAEEWTGTFQGGSGGAVQDIGGDNGVFDRASHAFSLSIQNTITEFDLSSGGAETITLRLLRGSTEIATGSNGLTVVQGLAAGDYTIELTLDQGLNVDYTLALTSFQDLNPRHLYQEI